LSTRLGLRSAHAAAQREEGQGGAKESKRETPSARHFRMRPPERIADGLDVVVLPAFDRKYAERPDREDDGGHQGNVVKFAVPESLRGFAEANGGNRASAHEPQ